MRRRIAAAADKHQSGASVRKPLFPQNDNVVRFVVMIFSDPGFFLSTLQKTQVEKKTQVLASFGENQPIFAKLRSNLVKIAQIYLIRICKNSG